MKWPVMWTRRHRIIISLLRTRLTELREINSTLKSENLELSETVSTQAAQIQSLVKVMTDPKCNALQSGERRKPDNEEAAPLSRGGWRGRSRMASEATQPKPKDSTEALELRVKASGGTV